MNFGTILRGTECITEFVMSLETVRELDMSLNDVTKARGFRKNFTLQILASPLMNSSMNEDDMAVVWPKLWSRRNPAFPGRHPSKSLLPTMFKLQLKRDAWLHMSE